MSARLALSCRLAALTVPALVVTALLVPTSTASAATVHRPPVWRPSSQLNRTPAGSKPTGNWTPTAQQTSGSRSSSANPATVAAAAGSLGMTPATAGSSAAGSGLGAQGFYGLETFGLDTIDGLQAQVNLSNGNLLVHSTDLKLNAPGLNLRLDRFYNSKSAGSGAFGANAVLSTGRDVGIQSDGSTDTFTGPSGFTAAFTRNGRQDTAPAGINATLTVNSDLSGYRLVYNKTGETLLFNAGGFLTSDADRNGNALSLLYNADDTLASITDAAGRVTSFHYSSGKISQWDDPSGRHEYYSYDSSGNLSQTTDANGGITTYSYDSSHRLTRLQTPAGTYTDFGYDSSNRLTSITRYLVRNSLTGGSVSTTFGYPSSTSTTETDPASHTTTYTLDSTGRVTSVQNALGKSKSQSWTPNSDLATAVDAMGSTPSAGNTTTFSYDTNNRLTAVATPTGAGAAAQYGNSTSPGTACASTDTSHPFQAKCVEDGQGNQTSLSYDGPGNVTGSSDTSGTSSGVARSYTYQGDAGVTSCGGKPGEMCSATNGNSHTTSYAYNSSGDLTSVTPPSPGTATTFGYDSLSRLTSVHTPNGITISYSYDARDQLTVTGYSTGGEVDYYYDADGDLTSRHDGAAGTETYTYDGLDRQLSTTTPGSAAAVTVTYSTAGDTASYTDPAGTVHYGYDAGHELTSLAEPGGSCSGTISGCTRFGYDANGSRTDTDYPGGTVQQVSYDASGRATEVKAANSNAALLTDTAYRYSTGSGSDTRLVQSSKLSTSSLAIDAKVSADSTSTGGTVSTPSFSTSTSGDVLLAFAGSDGSSGSSQTISVAGAGLSWSRVTGENGARGDSEIWTATATGSLTGASVTATDSVTGYHQSLSVLAFKGAAGIGNSAHASGTSGAPTVSVTTTAAQSQVFAVGNDWDSATARSLAADQSMVHEFGDSATGDDYWLQRTSVPVTSAGSTATMASSAPTADRWDIAAVEVRPTTVSTTSTTNSYDTLNRLTAASESTGGTTSASWAYGYDHDGNRTSNSVTTSGGTTTTSQAYNAIDELTSINGSGTGLGYDADGNETANPGGAGVPARTGESNNARDQLIGVTVGASTTSFGYLGESQTDRTVSSGTTFQNALLGLSSQTSGGATTSFVRTPDGSLIAEQSAGSSQYYLSDELGSVVGLVDATGNRTASYSYDPYGRARTATGASAAANPFRYTGGYTDTSTGLTKLGARYYDPNVGRFTQPDPSGQELNRYAYAADNPAGRTDPSGLWSFSISGSACAWGLCVGASVGIDGDGDVNVSGDAGVGTPGVGGGASFDPNGNYSQGASASESVSCSLGNATVGLNSDGSTYGTINSSYAETPGCQATVNGGYTF